MVHGGGLAGGPLDALTERILGAAFEVHTRLGPHELRKRGFNVERQKDLPVRYDGVLVDAGYRLDPCVMAASSAS